MQSKEFVRESRCEITCSPSSAGRQLPTATTSAIKKYNKTFTILAISESFDIQWNLVASQTIIKGPS
ncbi:hypothetical protein MTP99_017064 [Tenebrio molitor]|nr:hypothetical protein MTP99_017064 [Tenebrio molitor]